MRILDRQRYGAFFKAYVVCFVSLVGLYVVIDAFTNIDEFTKRTNGLPELLEVMGRFYLVQISLIYDRLSGVISMMAAIFTVTWMQKNNELLAMMAAGISAQRVVRPVIICSLLVSALAMANQELIMPRIAEELQKSHGDDGQSTVDVFSRYDHNDVLIHGRDGQRDTRVVSSFSATLPVTLFGTIGELEAAQAQYIPEEAPLAPYKGGWLLRRARLRPADLTIDGSVLVPLQPHELDGFPPTLGPPEPGESIYFLHSNATFATLARKGGTWYQFARTSELMRELSDPSNAPERSHIEVFLHGRLVRPALGLTLLTLSLPLVLSGYGRNMFINLGLALATSAGFYATMILAQYLGTNEVLSPSLAAWIPLIGFGTLAAARWDTIRT